MKKIILILALSTIFMSCEESKNLPAPCGSVTPPSVQGLINVVVFLLKIELYRF